MCHPSRRVLTFCPFCVCYTYSSVVAPPRRNQHGIAPHLPRKLPRHSPFKTLRSTIYYFSSPTQSIESGCRVIKIPRADFERELQYCRDLFTDELLRQFNYRANPKMLEFWQASRIPVVWIPDVLILRSPKKVPRLMTPLRAL